jgi:hypothetical protein
MTPKVLIAPLDWGLGHATRCIPVIETLIDLGVEPEICASGGGRALLKKRYPSFNMIEIPSHTVEYPNEGSMAWSMMLQSIPLMRSIRKENEILGSIINESKFTHVISDNRYGLYSRSARSAIITHQLNVHTPGHLKVFKPLINGLVRRYIDQFDECWIPDNGSLLSGVLSIPNRSFRTMVRDIGILSRFMDTPSSEKRSEYDVIAVISGPEPQRTIFAEKVSACYEASDQKVLIAGGRPEEGPGIKVTGNITLKNDIDDLELASLLSKRTLYIGRSGYSSIMDLMSLGHKRVVLVPTPGQTEQEYLAGYLHSKYGTTVCEQDTLQIPAEISNTEWPAAKAGEGDLRGVLSDFLVS